MEADIPSGLTLTKPQIPKKEPLNVLTRAYAVQLAWARVVHANTVLRSASVYEPH
jgi:hypothetical protein